VLVVVRALAVVSLVDVVWVVAVVVWIGVPTVLVVVPMTVAVL
jgi:hypothetical protein